ncbi:uncharacterized protein LOC131929598 [Physella acuta]|uniref:uncharacterized protein LOC131929598 n=1 Tax=Physella acuta TaxID=109671 RepID=UPI0027DC7E01|nr:uncharacterized protein LOC131929598 [Physella acuta]XP_059141872.1 uncharacterized protein LOC131929598 [Physella acuta]
MGNNPAKDSSTLNAEGAVSAGIQTTVMLPDGSQKQMIVYTQMDAFQLKTSCLGPDYPHLDCYKVVVNFRGRTPVEVLDHQEFDQELLQQAKDISIVPISANEGVLADNIDLDGAIRHVQ